jgi:hypothetical protein
MKVAKGQTKPQKNWEVEKRIILINFRCSCFSSNGRNLKLVSAAEALSFFRSRPKTAKKNFGWDDFLDKKNFFSLGQKNLLYICNLRKKEKQKIDFVNDIGP